MRRRDLLAGAAALGATGIGAGYVFGVLDVSNDDAIEPYELETIEAPGSEAGAAIVPELGRVTFLELFATWCDVCERSMPTLGAVYDEFADREDLQFVSVTNEPIGRTVTTDDVAEWWATHDGRWTLAMDDDLELTEALDASAVPYSVVLNENNVVTWSHIGEVSADTLEREISAQLEQ